MLHQWVEEDEEGEEHLVCFHLKESSLESFNFCFFGGEPDEPDVWRQ